MAGKSIIVMGVSASGKSTVGVKLAQALGAKFIDGDDLHPRNNIVKMASGAPLNDEDRAPWLERINDAAYSLESKNEIGVIVCSALKKTYRDRIREGNQHINFLFLDGTKDIVIERIRQRNGHFFKEEMINSQFEALERPSGEVDVIIVDIDNTVDSIVSQAISQLDNLRLVATH
ncbi:gluconokinase [Vibrio sp. E150_011]